MVPGQYQGPANMTVFIPRIGFVFSPDPIFRPKTHTIGFVSNTRLAVSGLPGPGVPFPAWTIRNPRCPNI